MKEETPKMGRPTLEERDKKHRITVTLPWWVCDYLKKVGNRSHFIEKAVKNEMLNRAKKGN